jgi:hypothetical protein
MMLYYRLGELDADSTCRHKTVINFIVAILYPYYLETIKDKLPINVPNWYTHLKYTPAQPCPTQLSSPTTPDSGGRLLAMQRLYISKAIRNLIFQLRVHLKNYLVVLQWLFSGYAKHQQQTR